jgi:YD repeat-containing protein
LLRANKANGTSAVMTRPGLSQDLVTQTRSFQYDLATGHLLSVTKPETGTTSYVYNADGTVQHVTDAKNQRTTFTYEALPAS